MNIAKLYERIRSDINEDLEMIPHIGNGTSLQGYFPGGTTYDSIVKVFGEPNNVADEYKVDVEWTGRIDGEVFTIYNYKTGKNYLGKEGLDVKDITDWHIGGNSKSTVGIVLDYFKGNKNESKVIMNKLEEKTKEEEEKAAVVPQTEPVKEEPNKSGAELGTKVETTKFDDKKPNPLEQEKTEEIATVETPVQKIDNKEEQDIEPIKAKKVAESLESDIARARRREENDDHLEDEDRQKIVDKYRKAYPDRKLPDDMTDAFVEIIFENQLKEDKGNFTTKDVLQILINKGADWKGVVEAVPSFKDNKMAQLVYNELTRKSGDTKAKKFEGKVPKDATEGDADETTKALLEKYGLNEAKLSGIQIKGTLTARTGNVYYFTPVEEITIDSDKSNRVFSPDHLAYLTLEESKLNEQHEDKEIEIFKWLLGYYDFPERKEGDGAYWWRKELLKKLKQADIIIDESKVIKEGIIKIEFKENSHFDTGVWEVLEIPTPDNNNFYKIKKGEKIHSLHPQDLWDFMKKGTAKAIAESKVNEKSDSPFIVISPEVLKERLIKHLGEQVWESFYKELIKEGFIKGDLKQVEEALKVQEGIFYIKALDPRIQKHYLSIWKEDGKEDLIKAYEEGKNIEVNSYTYGGDRKESFKIVESKTNEGISGTMIADKIKKAYQEKDLTQWLKYVKLYQDRVDNIMDKSGLDYDNDSDVYAAWAQALDLPPESGEEFVFKYIDVEEERPDWYEAKESALDESKTNESTASTIVDGIVEDIVDFWVDHVKQKDSSGYAEGEVISEMIGNDLSRIFDSLYDAIVAQLKERGIKVNESQLKGLLKKYSLDEGDKKSKKDKKGKKIKKGSKKPKESDEAEMKREQNKKIQDEINKKAVDKK